MDLKHIFGKNVKYYRYRKNLTQAQLSEKINISVNYLGRIERGLHSVDFDLVDKIAAVLNIRSFELFLEPKDLTLPHRVDMQNK